MACLIVDDGVDVQPVDPGEVLRGEYVGGEAAGADTTLVQQDHLVGDGCGMAEVMEDDPEGSAPIGEIADQIEGLDLVSQVEVIGRLIQEQDAGVLSETRRQPHALQFPTGELIHGAVGHLPKARERQCAVDGRTIGITHTGEPPTVRMPTESDDVSDLETGRMRPRLREHRDRASELACGECSELSGADVDGSGIDRMKPSE